MKRRQYKKGVDLKVSTKENKVIIEVLPLHRYYDLVVNKLSTLLFPLPQSSTIRRAVRLLRPLLKLM